MQQGDDDLILSCSASALSALSLLLPLNDANDPPAGPICPLGTLRVSWCLANGCQTQQGKDKVTDFLWASWTQQFSQGKWWFQKGESLCIVQPACTVLAAVQSLCHLNGFDDHLLQSFSLNYRASHDTSPCIYLVMIPVPVHIADLLLVLHPTCSCCQYAADVLALSCRGFDLMERPKAFMPMYMPGL